MPSTSPLPPETRRYTCAPTCQHARVASFLDLSAVTDHFDCNQLFFRLTSVKSIPSSFPDEEAYVQVELEDAGGIKRFVQVRQADFTSHRHEISAPTLHVDSAGTNVVILRGFELVANISETRPSPEYSSRTDQITTPSKVSSYSLPPRECESFPGKMQESLVRNDTETFQS